MIRSPSMARKTKPRQRPAYRPQPEAIEVRQLPTARDLDPTSGSGGYALSGPITANAVALQADGTVLTAGASRRRDRRPRAAVRG